MENGPESLVPGLDDRSGPLEIHDKETIPVRTGFEISHDAIERHLRDRIPDLDPLTVVEQFPNGSANATYLLTFGDRRLVLRRPPSGKLPPGAHDMRREYRTLSRLYRAYPPAPRAYVFCDDRSVLGLDFFVMEYRDGVVVWDKIPESLAHHDRVGYRLGVAVVDALAQLHLVDPAACGLEDLGRPDGFVVRQVEGWAKRWELVAPATPLPAMNDALGILRGTVPTAQRAAILHNDPKLNNCQFRPEDPDRVYSVFDWDMATLGDPLVDLGTLLNYWPEPDASPDDDGVYTPGVEKLGLPARQEVAERYARQTGLDLSELVWYQAFASWRTVIALQQLYMRYVRGDSSDERMASRGERIGPLAERTLRLLQQMPS